MQLSSDANFTVSVKGSDIDSLLGGAAYAAVSRDFRGVRHLRFYQRVYGFISIERAFQIQGFYSFLFQVRSLFSGFATMTFSLCHHVITNLTI